MREAALRDLAAEAEDIAACLAPATYVDSDHPAIRAHAEQVIGDAEDEIERAKRLYLAVRDGILYDPYRVSLTPEDFTASAALARGYGFCINKSVLLAALARAVGIPARLGFADVRNHLTSAKLRAAMKTDVFAYHGYTDLFLAGKWVKATPAFNAALCAKVGVRPLDFDGVTDSVFHPFDAQGRRHMEYVRQRGVRWDAPLEEIQAAFRDLYGWEIGTSFISGDFRDFAREAEADA
jgi:transglutaminase-like putative cysteine protease